MQYCYPVGSPMSKLMEFYLYIGCNITLRFYQCFVALNLLKIFMEQICEWYRHRTEVLLNLMFQYYT